MNHMRSNFTLGLVCGVSLVTALVSLVWVYRESANVAVWDVSLLLVAIAVCILALRLIRAERRIEALERRLGEDDDRAECP